MHAVYHSSQVVSSIPTQDDFQQSRDPFVNVKSTVFRLVMSAEDPAVQQKIILGYEQFETLVDYANTDSLNRMASELRACSELERGRDRKSRIGGIKIYSNQQAEGLKCPLPKPFNSIHSGCLENIRYNRYSAHQLFDRMTRAFKKTLIKLVSSETYGAQVAEVFSAYLIIYRLNGAIPADYSIKTPSQASVAYEQFVAFTASVPDMPMEVVDKIILKFCVDATKHGRIHQEVLLQENIVNQTIPNPNQLAVHTEISSMTNE